MKKRFWSPEQKFNIVLNGFASDLSVEEFCEQQDVSTSQYYTWRSRLAEDGPKVFDGRRSPDQNDALINENNKLKQLVGDLTLQLHT